MGKAKISDASEKEMEDKDRRKEIYWFRRGSGWECRQAVEMLVKRWEGLLKG